MYRLYVNHFLPVTKQVAKVREGHRLKKVFDAPKTPYQRVLDSPQVSDAEKAKLRAIHAALDVVKLKRQLDAMMDALMPSAVG